MGAGHERGLTDRPAELAGSSTSRRTPIRVAAKTYVIPGSFRSARFLVPSNLSSFALGVVQLRASHARRGRDTGSCVDRGERSEVRAWAAARSVKRLGFYGTSPWLRKPRRRRPPRAGARPSPG